MDRLFSEWLRWVALYRTRCSIAFAGRVKRPRAAGLAVFLCLSAGCAAGNPVAIHDVQGAGGRSPLAGERVSIHDVVVTAVGERGFFVQQPDTAADGDFRTSEGVYVYGEVPEGLEPGDRVALEGTVNEYHGHTQLTSMSKLQRIGRGLLPKPAVLDEWISRGGLERLESMRVRVSDGVVASPTDAHGDVRIAPDGRRPLRTAASPGLRYLLEMNPAGLGGPGRSLAAGRRFAADGVLVFRFGDFVLWPTALRLGESPALPRPVRRARAGEMAVATYNLRLFYDHRRTGDEPVVAEAVYERRLAKHAAWLREVLQCPAVVAVQEVDARGVLARLARRSGCGYRSVRGERPSNLALGYLLGPEIALAGDVRQLGRERRLPGGGVLFDRPPLLAILRTSAGPVALVNVHLRSMRGLGEEPRVARKRRAQAGALNQLLGELLESAGGRVMVLGDFNALPFDDGRADVLGRVARGLDGSGLVPVWPRLEPGERYSYIYRGHGQMLDHALLSPALESWLVEASFGRGNAGAPWMNRDDSVTPLGASDHDPLVLFLRPETRSPGTESANERQ